MQTFNGTADKLRKVMAEFDVAMKPVHDGLDRLFSFRKCCRAVLNNAKDEYAKSYANAGLQLQDHEEVEWQIAYILNNLGQWRGDEARAVKLEFKRIQKELKNERKRR